MKLYIAGASAEITRADRWMRACKEAGIEVVSTWPNVIRSVGQSNPKDATPEQYQEWARRDLAEVRAADVFWTLLPAEAQTTGAWIEMGYAHALDKLIVASGQHRPIFTNAIAKFHSHYDAEVFEYLNKLERLTP